MVTSDEASGTFKCPTQNFSDFIENRVPLHFTFAADNFKRDNKDVFCRTRFEPNISIKPDESNWDCGLPKYLPFFWTHWIFSDSNAVIKNILIACSRVSAYVNNNTILQAKSTTNGRLSNFVIVCKTRPSSSH
jgi:hypothetical protein